MKGGAQRLGRLRHLSGPAFAVAASSLSATEAHAVVPERLSAAITGGVGYGSNPLLREGSNNDAGFVELSFAPSYSIKDERGGTLVEASVRGTQYFSKYDDTYTYGARARGDRQVSASTTLRAQADFESSIVGQRRPFITGSLLPSAETPDELPFAEIPDELTTNPLAEDQLDELVDVIDPDIALAGRRRDSLSAEAGARLQLNPADLIDVSLQMSKLAFPGNAAGTDSRTFGGSASYTRRLSATSFAGIRSLVQRTRFSDGLGSSTVYQPQILYSGQTVSGWSFSVAAGGLFIRSRTQLGKQRSSGLSGDATVCRSAVRTNFCFGASRGAEESGRGTINKQTSVFTSLSYRLSERQDLRFTAGLAETEQATVLENLGRRQERANVDYRLRLRERLEIGVTAAYQDIYGEGGGSVEADFRAEATLRVRLGR